MYTHTPTYTLTYIFSSDVFEATMLGFKINRDEEFGFPVTEDLHKLFVGLCMISIAAKQEKAESTPLLHRQQLADSMLYVCVATR